MRICYLASAGSLHFKRWYEFFIRRGHEVYLISGDTSLLKYKIDIPGLKIFYLPEKKLRNKIFSFGLNLAISPIIIFKLKEILRKINPDILHAHQVHPYGFWAALSNFRPFVITPMGSDILLNADKYKIYRKIAKYVFNKADFVTGSSLILKNRCLDIGLDVNKFHLIQNGVDLNIFKPNKDGAEQHLRDQLGIQEDCPIVFYGRGMVPLYNVDKIIASIPKVLKKFPNCKFVFAHNFGSISSKLKKMIKKLNLDNSVIFLGFLRHKDVPGFMRISDVFVSVPSSDNSPSSVYEAMACGLPTIINKLPWTEYAMRHRENTYMIDEINPSLISDAIISLLTNEELYNMIQQGGLKTVQKYFCYHSNMQMMEKIMLGLLNRNDINARY